jgi:hypothetical protein
MLKQHIYYVFNFAFIVNTIKAIFLLSQNFLNTNAKINFLYLYVYFI